MAKMAPASDGHLKAMRSKGDAFAQFMRNGVWGTCVECPRDSGNKAYPEFCKHGSRNDHQLSLLNLATAYDMNSR